MPTSNDSSGTRRLARRKLDQIGDWWRNAEGRLALRPHGGWIAATREALGMSQADLAQRLNVRPSSVAKIESSERAGTAQLDTLRRAAEALDCELVVALIPRQSLQSMVDQRRLALFRQLYSRTTMHMNLEGQAVSDDLRQYLVEQAEQAIPDHRLWRDANVV